ncbi:PRC-barrel domain-containing protein [Qipengyuania sp. XHP0211]|uniref:PRC-barrel domain-containing protein n=1 Tax=Qipengyuania sp. XHP0211 TaxID=3038079 RepID=UPI00241D75C1|nr:PRC-barrel domain-containing protein [Qipengyuania sp. XHP0211]MCH2498015.1 PRC-barrel domain-containing protein [Erythrobacter sp.]MDG5750492.1 PRC-barrel domain-containing protein [Qipengyuania sp. XHP0211]MEC7953632.1 PRC-barrel domain-containing protein [Pseudomonadota bacterium]
MHTEAEKNSAVISSDRVEGTAVFDRGGKNIGHVDHVLIEKRGGQATEAVLSVGGFLGMGDEKHCVPWSKLDYDTDLGGYHLNIDEDALREGPRFTSEERHKAYDDNFRSGVHKYYEKAQVA